MASVSTMPVAGAVDAVLVWLLGRLLDPVGDGSPPDATVCAADDVGPVAGVPESPPQAAVRVRTTVARTVAGATTPRR